MVAVGTGLAGFACLRVLGAERAAQRPPVISSEPGRTPAILVLGATATPSGPSRELAARLDHGWRLWRLGVASVVVVSGGRDGEIEEVYLTDLGVPSEQVIDGRPGNNTRQSLASAARIGAEHALGPWIAVSTPYHARRLRDEGKRRGLTLVASGPGDSPEMRNARVHRVRVATEIAGTVLYALPAPVMASISRVVGRHRHSLPRLIARAST
jgi:uncharacterized SAM-binding protein YcdF (DUF218 family)